MPLKKVATRKVSESVDRNIAALKGKYNAELNTLLDLSRAEREEISPSINQSDYANLISVVRHASEHNEDMADLVDEIKSLGEQAVKLAKAIGFAL